MPTWMAKGRCARTSVAGYIGSTLDARFCEPVSVTYRAGLRHVETEIGKWRAETGDRNPTVHDQKSHNCRPETWARDPNGPFEACPLMRTQAR